MHRKPIIYFRYMASVQVCKLSMAGTNLFTLQHCLIEKMGSRCLFTHTKIHIARQVSKLSQLVVRISLEKQIFCMKKSTNQVLESSVSEMKRMVIETFHGCSFTKKNICDYFMPKIKCNFSLKCYRALYLMTRFFSCI